jgi:uncharacterized protein YjcR
MGVRTIAAYDWPKIKAEYISSSISLRDLASKHGIPFPTVRDRAKREGWTAERDALRNKIVSRTLQKTAEKVSTKIAAGLDKEYAIADKLADVLVRALADDKQFNRHIVNQKMRIDKIEIGTATEKIYDKLDMAAVAQAVKSLQGIETTKRRIKGILTEAERQHYDIERERLDLEKKKADRGDADEGEHGVVVLPDIIPEPDEPAGDDDA